MIRSEWFVVDYGDYFKDHAQMVFPTHQHACSQAAGKHPVYRLILDKDWTAPEEWVTPTDEDARHRPMVQVSFLGDWLDARLLAVVEHNDTGCFVVCECLDLKGHVETYVRCRMKASERNKR